MAAKAMPTTSIEAVSPISSSIRIIMGPIISAAPSTTSWRIPGERSASSPPGAPIAAAPDASTAAASVVAETAINPTSIDTAATDPEPSNQP